MSDFLFQLPPGQTHLHRLYRQLGKARPTVTIKDHRLTIHSVRLSMLNAGYHNIDYIHSVYELFLILGGQAEFLVGDPVQLEPGSAILAAPGIPHPWRLVTGPSLCLVCCFEIEPMIPQLYAQHWPAIPSVLREAEGFLRDITEAREGWMFTGTAHLLAIIGQLCPITQAKKYPSPARQQPVSLENAVEQYLKANVTRAISVDELAEHVGMSVRNLSRKFRQLTGKTVVGYIIDYRLGVAAESLLYTEEPIAKIALRVGFTDSAYFARLFRRQYDTTPQAYRKSTVSLKR